MLTERLVVLTVARAQAGGVQVGTVRVVGPTAVEGHSVLGDVWLSDVRLDHADTNSDGTLDHGGAGSATEGGLRVLARSLKGDARVGLASSAGALGGGGWELSAPFGRVALSQARLDPRYTVDGEGAGGLSKPGLNLAALETDYSIASGRLSRDSLIESDSEGDENTVPEGWKGTGHLASGVTSRAGVVTRSQNLLDVPRWDADPRAMAEVVVWSGKVGGVAGLVVVEELGPTDDDEATAMFPAP